MKKHLFPLFFLFLVFMGCMPNAQEENKLHHQAELQYDLWKEDSTAIEQAFSLREDTVTTIICEGGTKILIPAHAFVLEDNPDRPLQGPVELRVLEVYRAGEMLRHHLTTQEKSGKLLESAGMIYLAAFAEGKVLRLKKGKKVLLGFPKKKDFKRAALFSGVRASGEALRWEKEESTFDLRNAIVDTYFGGAAPGGLQIVNAEEASTVYPSETGVSRDTAIVSDRSIYPRALIEDEPITDKLTLLADYDNYFFFSTPQLNWINCDRFVEEEVANLRVDISGFPQNTLYYLVFEELNSVMAGYRKAGEPEESNPVFEQVPLGRQVKLVVVFNRGGDYYLAEQEVLTAEGQTIALEPVATAKDKIRNHLQSLATAEGLTASR